ncbi:MAG: aminotransferase class I/II-fold pyridoxal phosphate-dependent enzyme [Flavobacteriaceae bacterium]|jgi:histidinol-phosphate aminotransferase|nr:aminotransferase class I/II-fold pyridoxal phosphate-dependent enzyme [Flavobacteriaceae bacterium]
MSDRNIKYFVVAFLFLSVLMLNSCKQQENKPSVAESQIDGKDIRLSLNENPFEVDESIKDSIIKEIANINRYVAEDGKSFIEFIAAHEGVSPEQIIPGEILSLLGVYLALKNGEGSEFIQTVPGYPVFANAAAGVGGKVIDISLDQNLENDFDAIEKKITSKTAAIFLVNPHNPSGVVTESKKLHDFISRVSKKTLIIIDEAYLEYASDFKERTALSNLKSGDNILIFRTLAKAYGLGGLTIGYAIAPKELAQYLRSKGLGNTHALNRLSIAAAKASLSNQDKIIKESKIIQEERDKWHTFLDNLSLKHSDSKANFVFFDTGRSSSEVKKLFLDNGIAIGPIYEDYPTWIRITIGTPTENTKVQSVLKEIIKK